MTAHARTVRGVLATAVKVRVVSHLQRQVQLDLLDGKKGRALQVGIAPQATVRVVVIIIIIFLLIIAVVVVPQEALQAPPHGQPDGLAVSQKGVERRLVKDGVEIDQCCCIVIIIMIIRIIQEARFRQDGQVNHRVAQNGRTAAPRITAIGKDAKGKIVNGKVRIAGHVQPRFARRHSER